MSESSVPKRCGRGKSKLKRSAVTRGAEALLAAKLPLKRVEIDPATGRINYIIGSPGEGGDTPEGILGQL
jgi:hypothetical protein